ncbi:hypothetical protein RDI58_029173 [Solanum bulbocastanum]|uniref:WAT1-related protein n=1 Tax=Solanum bulbocastanum TaxID=147425 RepID=A0AAN8XZP6_SOLBU
MKKKGSDLLPFIAMVIVQVGYAGSNVVTKLVMDTGMDPFVQTAYRPIFATISIAPFAYFLERKSRPKLTLSVFFQIFLCSIIGVCWRSYDIVTVSWTCSDWPIGISLEARVNEKYAAPYSSTLLMFFMASFQCMIISFCVVPKASEWALNPIRAISVVYNGTVCSSLALYLCSWCIERKGPLYVSMFNPLLLVIAAFLSWILLREKLYLGIVVGSILTVVGLYGFLWGQKKEMQQSNNKNEIEEEDVVETNKEDNKADLELQLVHNSDIHAFPTNMNSHN